MTENEMQDIAIKITDKLVQLGYVPDCTDTDLQYEFEVQDVITEILLLNTIVEISFDEKLKTR